MPNGLNHPISAHEIKFYLKQMFKFGSEEETEFRYIGMNVKQSEEGITVDQDHYLSGLEIPKLDDSVNSDEILNSEGQTQFRGIVGKLNHISSNGRPASNS